MSVEQDWSLFASQSAISGTETLLARTAAGAGVQIPGSAFSVNPFEGDNRPTEELLPTTTRSRKERLREFHRDPTRSYVEAVLPLRVGKLRNLWCYTETLSNSLYAVNGVTKQTETVVVDGITLTRITSTSFYDNLWTSLVGNSLTPFTVGKLYCVSMYVLEHGSDPRTEFPLEQEKFLWMKDKSVTAGNKAFARRYATNRLRRVWVIGKATTTSALDLGGDSPSVAYGSGAGTQIFWYFSGQNGTSTRNVYVGGFSFEEVGDDTYKDGIACIGDSTMQGSSGADDAMQAREFTGYIEASLNVTAFNRGVAGNTLSVMAGRWATDITPLKVRSKYVIIQGGINDIVTGRTIGQMQTDLATMVGYAATDGMIPIFLTCTPTTSIAANATYEAQRIAYNKWLRETYRDVIDIARVIEDPTTISRIRNDPDWTGDGIHYATAAKRAVGMFVAEWPGWEFFQPGPYQVVAGALGSYTAPASLVEGSAGRIIGQRGAAVTDAVASVAAPTMAEFNALVTQFNALLARMRIATGHGLIS